MSTTTKQIGAVIIATDDDKGTIRIKSATPCEDVGIDQPESTAKRIGKAIAYLTIIAIPVSLVGIMTYCVSWLAMSPSDATGVACGVSLAIYPVTAVLAIERE